MNTNPCPFCGDPEHTEVHAVIPALLYIVQCASCSAVGPGARTGKGAIQKWNLRALAFTLDPAEKELQ